MQFIAEDPIRVVVRSEIRAIHDTSGRMVAPKQRRVFAQFKRGIAEPWLVRKAAEAFEFRKKPEDVGIAQWGAYYDTLEAQKENSWTDEEVRLIEETLHQNINCVLVEKERLPAPYPNYDKHRKTQGKRTVEHAIADITATYETAGFDLGLAIAYERENGNDPQVVTALEALSAPVVEAEEELVSA